MRTRNLLLILMCAASMTAFAQENISIGPVIGGNLSTLRGDIDNVKSRPGINVGGFFNYSSQSRLGLRVELLYTTMGTHFNNSDQERNLQYIQLPVLGTLYLNDKGHAFRPKVFAGPYFGYLLKSTDDRGNVYNDSNGDFEKFDAGVKLGVGFNYRLNNKVWLNTDLYFGQGLVDLSPAKNVDFKNQGVGLNVGLSFPLGTYTKSNM
ncbi:outer membrane beta-barrel protein [Emticicia sp. CRIBPO]|uniref:porin family protein n=1 Tax=Emticicia sp. CRIBPO TaxID=2683258 RepID=UPI0014127318|nr:porin family protein [Emticicia sp. CRIBPO]NBA84970.1 outer membrane beta-barrel protein [Emticicia sp. CRIBPO]